MPLDQTLSKEEWNKKISKIDINKTLSLYDGEEKKFDKDVKRDRFWLNIRIRQNIGYVLLKALVFVFVEN